MSLFILDWSFYRGSPPLLAYYGSNSPSKSFRSHKGKSLRFCNDIFSQREKMISPCGGEIFAYAKVISAVRMTLQERLTAQIADFLNDEMTPLGVAVVIEAEHLCMTMRGAKASGAQTRTSALRGLMRSDARTRAEAMQLLKGGSD